MDANKNLMVASPAKIIHAYKNTSFKIISTQCAIWLNQRCLKLNIAPKYIINKTKNQNWYNRPHQLTKTRRKLIKKELRKIYAKQDRLYTEKKIIYNVMIKKLPFDTVNEELTRLNIEIRRYENKRRRSIKIKVEMWSRLKKEIRNSRGQSENESETNINIVPFYGKLVNVSDVNFDPGEVALLEKGLHHNPPTNIGRIDFESLMVDTEIAIENSRLNDKDLLKDFCAIKLRDIYKKKDYTTRSNKQNNRVIKTLQNKIRTYNLIVTRADKGKTTIILKKSDYIDKVEAFLVNNNFENINKFNTESFNNKFIKLIKKSNPVIPDDMVKKLKVNTYQTPRLYGLLKLHKSNIFSEIPIRPVANYCNASTYKLAKFLSRDIKDLLDFKPKYAIKNTCELIKNTKDLQIPNEAILASLDVSNLFTNIPPKEVVSIIIEKLKANQTPTNIIIIYQNLLEFCLSQNVFIFNEKFWIQNEGLAMGSPISPILAEIYMDFFEDSFLKDATFKHFNEKIKIYYRYVDDILMVWTGTTVELQTFLVKLNSIKPNIKFTLELQNEKRELNFLDVTLKIIDNKLEYKIYHKPTYTGQTICKDSFHHHSHKLAAFHTYIHRLLTIPQSEQNFELEKTYIKKVAAANGYDTNIIDKLIRKKQYRQHRQEAYNNTQITGPQKYITLNYIGNPSEQIKNILESNIPDTKVTFKNKKSLKSLIENAKDKVKLLDKSGVYKLTCNNCDKFYIGKTFRHLKTRIKEHLSGKSFSQFYNHLQENNHTFNSDNGLKLLHQHNYNEYLLNYETLEIHKALKKNPTRCLNSQNNIETSKIFRIFD